MHIRVLVADDHPVLLKAIVDVLQSDPALEVVRQAMTGREAIDLAEKLRPDVMILDLSLPDIGGLEVLETLRISQPQIKIIVLTASEQASALLDAIAAGAAGYLSKRTGAEELRQAVITAHGGGSVVTPSLAIHLLTEFSRTAHGESSIVRPLAGRELAILRLVMDGKTDNEIGEELFISARTVQNHLARIREKTGLRRRAELARWAAEHALA